MSKTSGSKVECFISMKSIFLLFARIKGKAISQLFITSVDVCKHFLFFTSRAFHRALFLRWTFRVRSLPVIISIFKETFCAFDWTCLSYLTFSIITKTTALLFLMNSSSWLLSCYLLSIPRSVFVSSLVYFAWRSTSALANQDSQEWAPWVLNSRKRLAG